MKPDFQIEIRNLYDPERLYHKRLGYILHTDVFQRAFRVDMGEFYVMDCDRHILFRCIIDGEKLVTFCSPNETEIYKDTPYFTYLFQTGKDGEEMVLLTGSGTLPAKEMRLMELLHQASFGSGARLLENPQTCGCFYCGRIFSSEELTEDDFVHENDGSLTAICPYCGIDAVIHEECGCPITETLLHKMHAYFF